MTDTLDPDDPRPLWQQLAEILRGQIEAGKLAGKLPSAVALARQYGCSRDTSLRALATLQEQGLVVSTVGRGSFVVPPDRRS